MDVRSVLPLRFGFIGVVIPLELLSGSAALAGPSLAREIFIRRFQYSLSREVQCDS